ncbi:MAG: alpha/beta fold hydrolase [Paracoccaceae bacterium]
MAEKSLQEIENKLRATAGDPFRFDELVETWNVLFDAHGADGPEAGPAEVERIVDATFAAFGGAEDDQRRSQLQRVINGLPHAALMVRGDGVITGLNEVALERLDLDPGDLVSKIDYALERDEPLVEVISSALDRRNGSGEVVLKRAVHGASDRAATLAIVPSRGAEAGLDMALLFVIDPVWRAEVEALMARAYELTSAEARVLMGFLDGHSLQDVAAQRGTSYATVRTQFQTVMAKTGARSQAELMRNTLAVSQFFTDVKKVADVAGHPYRKRIDLFRPGGRSVDVTLAGDMSGPLVVYIPDTTQCTFQAQVEAAFLLAGICVASLCRPGFGRTDPPVAGHDYEMCLAEDIAAFQDQYGAKKTPVMAHNSSSCFAYRVGALIPDRVKCIVVVSSLVPKKFMKAEEVGSPWVAALMRTAQISPRMYRMIVGAAIRSWKAMGSRRMFSLQFASYKRDVALAILPESVEEHESAVNRALAQGLDYAVIAFDHAMRDWSDWITDCPVPIELIQGRHDPIASAGSIETLAAAYPDQIKVHMIEDGGYMLFMSHTRQMVDLLSAAARR